MVNRRSKVYPVEYLEQKHLDLSLPYPNDSSFFYGGDKEGNVLFAGWVSAIRNADMNTGSIYT
jgi:hypothetical protein